MVGFIAYNEEEISQLYVHIDYQGMGIGTELLNRAKAQAKDKLSLCTFEVNKKAQGFYEKNSFKIIGKDHENEEMLPDILYQWSLQD